jgi:imidazoleglycerol phosphate synthase glutamine amidotransferase subunit HisH
MEIVQKIVIIDYGMANLRSVQKAFARVGALATITSLPGDLEGADKLVLPGVGAFRDAIVRLRQTGRSNPRPRSCGQTLSRHMSRSAAAVHDQL